MDVTANRKICLRPPRVGWRKMRVSSRCKRLAYVSFVTPAVKRTWVKAVAKKAEAIKEIVALKSLSTRAKKMRIAIAPITGKTSAIACLSSTPFIVQ